MRPLSFRLTVHGFAGRQVLDQGTVQVADAEFTYQTLDTQTKPASLDGTTQDLVPPRRSTSRW